MCLQASSWKEVGRKSPSLVEAHLWSLEELQGRYMVRQAFRTLKVPSSYKLGKGPGMEGYTPGHMMCYRGGVPHAFSHDSALSIEVPARSHSSKKRKKKEQLFSVQQGEGSRQIQEGKSQRAWISQDGFLLPARGCIINIHGGGEAGKVQWEINS